MNYFLKEFEFYNFIYSIFKFLEIIYDKFEIIKSGSFLAKKKNVLFVCTGNLDRSPTAEQLYKDRNDLEVKSAGTHWSAPRILTGDLIEWAEIVFVMEEHHQKFIINWMPEVSNKVIVLGIENKYLNNDPELIRILRLKIDPFLIKK